MAFGKQSPTDQRLQRDNSRIEGHIPAKPVSFEDAPVASMPVGPVAVAAVAGIEPKAKRSYKRDPLAPVPLDILNSAEDVPEEEWSTRPLKSGPVRSDMQQVIDAKVKALHEKWTEAGKPDLAHSPRSLYRVGPEHAASIRRMLTSAGNHLGITVKHDSTNDMQGRVAIVFTARDKRERVANAVKSDTSAE